MMTAQQNWKITHFQSLRVGDVVRFRGAIKTVVTVEKFGESENENIRDWRNGGPGKATRRVKFSDGTFMTHKKNNNRSKLYRLVSED